MFVTNFGIFRYTIINMVQDIIMYYVFELALTYEYQNKVQKYLLHYIQKKLKQIPHVINLKRVVNKK